MTDRRVDPRLTGRGPEDLDLIPHEGGLDLHLADLGPVAARALDLLGLRPADPRPGPEGALPRWLVWRSHVAPWSRRELRAVPGTRISGERTWSSRAGRRSSRSMGKSSPIGPPASTSRSSWRAGSCAIAVCVAGAAASIGPVARRPSAAAARPRA